MAFGSVGSLGSASAKAASQTLTMNPSSAVPAGHLVAVFVAWEGDRNYSDSAGVMDQSLACTDDAGNLYTTLQSGLYDVSDSIFLTYVDFPLTTSNVITITHRSNAQIPKAMSAWEFTIGAGKRFAYWRDVMNAAEDTSGDPRALSTGSLNAGTEYLILHCLAAKRPSSDSYTWDSDYTQITSSGTTGGATNSNVTLRGGYRIVSGITGDTVDVTNTTAGIAPDCWQGIVPISEIDYDSDFPTFPNFDDFNRADVDPLPTPPWSNSTTIIPGQGTALVRNVSNQAARSASGTFHGAQFWNLVIPAGDDGEVFATLAVAGVAGLHLFASGSGQNATLGGYAAYWQVMSDARPDRLEYGDSGNTGGGVSRSVFVWANQANGYKWGLQLRQSGAVMQLWVDVGSGWRWVSAYYRTSFVTNGGMFGLNFANDFTTRIEDFGGGTSSPFVPVPQIIRRLP